MNLRLFYRKQCSVTSFMVEETKETTWNIPCQLLCEGNFPLTALTDGSSMMKVVMGSSTLQESLFL